MFSPHARFKDVHYITLPTSLVASGRSQRDTLKDQRTQGQMLRQEALEIWIRKTAAGGNLKKSKLASKVAASWLNNKALNNICTYGESLQTKEINEMMHIVEFKKKEYFKQLYQI